MSVDRNRPQIRRTNAQGITVIEFNDQPGSYFDVHGNEASDAVAADAGFDVKAGRRARRKRDLEAEAQKRIDKQVAREFGEIESALNREEAAGDLQLVEGPKGKWSVVESDGRVLVGDLSKKEAEEALADLRGRGDAA